MQSEFRNVAPSQAIKKEITIGTPIAIITSYLGFKLQQKFGIPLDATAALVGLVIQGATTAVSYIARGGRRGESTAEAAHERINQLEVATGLSGVFRTIKDPEAP